jgi:CDP-diacylglycerol--glycerol-3-phosphate 3-phosphatidyltransferase
MNIANKLTIIRIFLIPVFVVFLLLPIIPVKYEFLGVGINFWIAEVVFVVASLTDLLDGYLARKHNLVTDFGKFMDPLADKLLVCSALICFTGMGILPSWMVLIIIAREFIISGFRLVAASKGTVIAASWWGKYKTTSQIIMIVLLILDFDYIYFNIAEFVFIYLAIVLTIISLVDYLIKNKDVFMEGSRE